MNPFGRKKEKYSAKMGAHTGDWLGLSSSWQTSQKTRLSLVAHQTG